MVLKLFHRTSENHYQFENDVKMYGTQTLIGYDQGQREFENDVKMYGTQTKSSLCTLVM